MEVEFNSNSYMPNYAILHFKIIPPVSKLSRSIQIIMNVMISGAQIYNLGNEKKKIFHNEKKKKKKKT